MTFLNPTILFGLFAASIPLLIHLLNLRKIKKVEFSTLAFLKEIQKSKIKKVKLKQWLLLLLRTLIILFLVSAFARPTLESVSFPGVSSSAKTSAVFIIDNSMSMGYVTENGNFLNQSKQIIAKVIKQLQNGDDVSIVSTTSSVSVAENEKNTKLALKKLNLVELTDAIGNISNSLLAAYKILSSSKNYNKEIYLFSDLQQSNLNKSEIERIFSSDKIDKNIRIYIYNIKNGKENNIAITGFSSENQIFIKNKTVRFNTIVTNNSDKPVIGDVLSLFVDGKRSAQKSIDLKAGQSKQISFNTKLPKTGLIDTYVRLEDDNQNADNVRYLGVFVPKRINVIIYSQNQSDAKYIKAVFVNDFNSNIKVKIQRPEQFSNNINDKNVVRIFVGTTGLNLKLLNKESLRNKSFIIFPAENESLSSFNKLLNDFKIGNAKNIVSLNNDYLKFDKIDFNHPIFNDLFLSPETRKIESPVIKKFVKINQNGKIKPIITLLDNSVFLGEINRRKTKVLLFSVAPTLSWSNFPMKGIFAPIIERAVYYLASNNENSQATFAGKPVTVDLRKLISLNIKAVLPNGNEIFISDDKLKGKTYFHFTNTFDAGIYKFYSGNDLFYYASVNIEPKEIQNKFYNSRTISKTIKNSGFVGKIIVADNYLSLKNKIIQSRFGTELWRLFLLLAFITAIIEMFVSKSSKKDLTELDKNIK